MPGKKSIKIAYIIDAIKIGGTEKQLLKQIELFSEKGYKQYLFCLRQSDFLNNIEIPCKVIILNVKSLVSFEGLKKMFLLSSILKSKDIDIVQAYFIDANIFGILAAKIAKVKKILSCRRDMGYWYNKKNLVLMRILNYFVDRILVNSISIKKNVVKFERADHSKIDVYNNGISLSSFEEYTENFKLKDKLGIPINSFVVGIVANLNRRVKRVDLFIKMAASILELRKDVHFVIVGGGNFEKALRDITAELGIEQNITFVGIQENVIQYLRIFNIGVLTSESEGFSNSIIEYMAAGLPVVCFDSAANKELIEDGKNGYLVKFDEYTEMGKKISLLIEQNCLVKLMKDANLKKAQTFSWDNVIRELDIYYHSLVYIDRAF